MSSLIHWASLCYWWVMPVFLFIFICYLFRQYKIRQVIQYIAGRWQSLVVRNFGSSSYYIKAILYAAGLFFLGVALLRPQWHKQEKTYVQEGRDLLIALDISRSMLATDCNPNRLAVAKKKIKKLLAMLPYERVGLILFSGSAFVQCPLTTDYQAFHMFLDHVDVETISSGSTALDAALQQGLQTFKNIPECKNKLMVILTDGEDFSSNLSRVKQEAQQCGMKIFTIGVGTKEGAPIPLYDDKGQQIGHQKDAQGKVVITQLNDNLLRALSSSVGGCYIPLTYDSKDLAELIEYIVRFEKERFEDKQVTYYDDKYHYFLFLSLICLLIEWLL